MRAADLLQVPQLLLRLQVHVVVRRQLQLLVDGPARPGRGRRGRRGTRHPPRRRRVGVSADLDEGGEQDGEGGGQHQQGGGLLRADKAKNLLKGAAGGGRRAWR